MENHRPTDPNWATELDQLLNHPATPAAPEAGRGPRFRPVLLGAGALGRVVCERLRKGGVEPLAFADNNPLRWETNFEGLPVLSVSQATERFGFDVPIVVTIYTGAEVTAGLRRLGLNIMTFPELARTFPDLLLPWGAMGWPADTGAHSARIREAFTLWADDLSRAEYVAQVRFRQTLAGPLPPHLPAEATYFPGDLVSLDRNELFVDCGAFDGDSVTAFLRRTGGWFGGAVAIEGDPQNAARLAQFISRLPPAVGAKVEVVQAAVGATNGVVRFHSSGSAASNYLDGQGTLEVPCRKLDDILGSRRATYIKMDIEGAEPQALAGARQIIQRDTPVLAIVLYHRPSDLWELPLQIRTMTDRYRFYLRRYSDDCWEQVLYAIPNNRVNASASPPGHPTTP